MRLFKLSITMVAVALLLAATTGPAMGEVTNPLDSSAFDVTYDFDADGVLPTGFTRAGNVIPTVSGGTMVSDTSANAGDFAYFLSGASQIWGTSGITKSTGYTIETKIRVDSIAVDAIKAFDVYSGPVDGTDAIGLLSINPDGQKWGYSTITNLGYNDNSDDYHVFRYAQEPGADSFSVWRDDVRLVSEITADWSYPGLVRMLFGDAGGSPGGKYEMDYLRFTPGAYTPVNEIIPPDPDPPAATMASTAFDYKYEMDVDPTNQAAIDLDANGASDWTNFRDYPVSSVSGGILTMPDGSILDNGIDNATDMWRNVGFSAADGFTCEISMRVEQSNAEGTTYASPLNFNPSDLDERGRLEFSDDKIVWYGKGTILDGIDNTDGQHIYRIARDSNADGGKYWVWRDEDLLTPEGAVGTATGGNWLYFGSGSATDSGGVLEVDYIRLISGAYSPDERVYFPGDANFDGSVDVTDLGILATNYGVTSGMTWEEGDFTGDSAVDVSDLGILATNYGTTAPAAVPEPSGLLLLASGLFGLFFYVKRQTRRSR